ncbi:hypothetical protein R1sor_015653 [Riccia sorocarpa]|uniref:Uncharacterized protein n=1 Tax=Riccia sorocarpa TaxID=122646 RepID=A0ABD3HIZ3_9MARC
MDVCAQLSDPLFQDIQPVPCESDGTISISANFCAARWKLRESSVYINERREILDRQATVLINQSKPGFWVLKAGFTYIVFGTAVDTTPTTSVRDCSSKPSEIVDSRIASKLNWEGVDCSSSIVSGFEACLKIEGTSELSKLELPNFEHRVVSFLLDSYDGNVIFELPPSTPDALSKKGGALVGMDRGNDCWLWTKCITTSAQIGGRNSMYSVNKLRCVGSLKCENDSWSYLLSEGVANMVDWHHKVHREKPYDVGSIVPLNSHWRTFAPAPTGCFAQHVKAMRDEVTDTLNKSPHFTPSQVRAAVSQSLFSKMLEGLKDRLGTTEAFEKAFDIAVRQTDPLRNIPHTLNGDINTTTYKRKGPTTSTIRSGDTHRYDRVAVTSQVTRRVKGRLQFDFTTTHSIPVHTAVPTTHTIPDKIRVQTTHTIPVEESQITTISSSTDHSTELKADDALHEISRQDAPSYFQAHENDPFQAEYATDSLPRQEDTSDIFRIPPVACCSFQPENAVGSFPLQQDLDHDSPDQHDAAHHPEQQDGMANTNITDLSSDSELRQDSSSGRPQDTPGQCTTKDRSRFRR